MFFIDEICITIKSGNGGNGYLSFYHDKYSRKKADGGKGGKGGDVFFIADKNLNTLIKYRYNSYYSAKSGKNGYKNNCTGKNGKNLILKVPVGTKIFNQKNKKFLGEIIKKKDIIKISNGGNPGLGNYYSKNQKNLKKNFYGEYGKKYLIRLELNLIADVSIIGFPNSGKSSLISVISNIKPKIEEYPFTTLYPHLGVVKFSKFQDFIAIDIPGIIEGSSKGLGLGSNFLKHISRNYIILHIIDISSGKEQKILYTILTVIEELKKYNPTFLLKERWIIFTKIDLLKKDQMYLITKKILNFLNWKGPVHYISSSHKMGIKKLVYDLYQKISILKSL